MARWSIFAETVSDDDDERWREEFRRWQATRRARREQAETSMNLGKTGLDDSKLAADD